MSSTFPTSLDSFTNPTSGDNLSTSVGGRTHSAMHADLADAVENLEAKVGIDGSAVATSIEYRLTNIPVQSATGRLELSGTAVQMKAGSKYLYMEEDFLWLSNLFTQVAAGTGASASPLISQVTGRPGIMTLNTGTTTSGKALVGNWQSSGAQSVVVLGDGTIDVECYFRIPTLSDGTDTFTVFLGLGDNSGGGTPTDGVYFSYIHSTNSGKFNCVTRSNGVETSTDSGTTVVANQWYKAKISINAAGTSVAFYLTTDMNAYGAAAATNTTNIPTGTARATGFQWSIIKSAGTTARTLEIDRVQFIEELTTGR